MSDSGSALGAIEVIGINDLGQVAGTWNPGASGSHAFRTAPNQPINPLTDDLGTLGGFGSRAYGINGLGQVVGESTTASLIFRAFRTSPNQRINPATDDLGTSGGFQSRAYAINNLGQAVGQADAASGTYHAFRTGPNQPINRATDDLGTLGGSTLLLLHQRRWQIHEDIHRERQLRRGVSALRARLFGMNRYYP